MRKRRIAVLQTQCPFMRGGAELLVGGLTKQLRSRGYEAEIVSMPFKWYPENVLLDQYFMWRMVDLTQSNGQDIDLVIATKIPNYMVKHPNKVLWLMHQHRVAYDLKDSVPASGLNTTPNGRKVMKAIINMDNLAISESKGIYTISKTVTDRLKKYNNINSIPLYHPPALAGQYYTENFENYILSVGRLDPNKRIDLLIRGLAYCDSNIKAVIAGTGAIRPQLEQIAEELEVKDRVVFLGFVPDEELPKLYANALAVCFPPIDEDYGYITLEAFLSQKPVVTCYDSGGVLEFVEQEKNGLICNVSPEEIGAAFNRLYHNKALAKQYGVEGYEKVKDIKWDHVIDELTKTIR